MKKVNCWKLLTGSFVVGIGFWFGKNTANNLSTSLTQHAHKWLTSEGDFANGMRIVWNAMYPNNQIKIEKPKTKEKVIGFESKH